jgi:hypothetical protein
MLMNEPLWIYILMVRCPCDLTYLSCTHHFCLPDREGGLEEEEEEEERPTMKKEKIEREEEEERPTHEERKERPGPSRRRKKTVTSGSRRGVAYRIRRDIRVSLCESLFFIFLSILPPLLPHPQDEATVMVSDASKKKAAQKKAAAAAKRGAKVPTASSSSSAQKKDVIAALSLSDRTCTGVLASHPLSRDIHVSLLSCLNTFDSTLVRTTTNPPFSISVFCIFLMLQIESLSLTFHGHDLIVDSELELNYGRYK